MYEVVTFEIQMYLAQLVGQAPWLLVMLIGGLVCLSRLATRPRESWLVGCAIGLMLFASIGTPQLQILIDYLIPGFLNPTGTTDAWSWRRDLLFGLPNAIIRVTAWGLILYAAFGEGSGPRSKYLVEDERSEREAD